VFDGAAMFESLVADRTRWAKRRPNSNRRCNSCDLADSSMMVMMVVPYNMMMR
jgi:hypothetical protein